MDPIDTRAEAQLGDAVILDAMQRWTPERRSVALSRLTALVRASSRQAWRHRHPELDARSSDIAWAETQYGPAVGLALRRWHDSHP